MEAELRTKPGAFGQPMTPEQRDKSAATRRRKSEERKASTLTSYAGSELDAKWAEFAKRRGVRLPLYGIPCTARAMSTWLRKLGLSLDWYQDWAGEKDLSLFIKRNPAWALRSFCGLILEELEPWEVGA